MSAEETRTSLVRRARKIDRVLAETYPEARCELDFDSAFELLVVTVLSAQTTDRRVNAVRPTLFAAYPDPASMAAADRATLEGIVGPLGFFRAKTESLLKLSAALVERYDGQVPGRLEDLVTLPGVGRKTANVVLGNAFDVPGITVDTHFGRLVRRFGWTEQTDPVKVEHDDRRAVPQARLDDAVPPRHLARPAHLPRQEARLRCVPAVALVPGVRRGPRRPGGRRGAGEDPGARMRRLLGSLAAVTVLVVATGCNPSVATPEATTDIVVDTPRLREMKAEAGIDPCVPGTGEVGAGGLPALELPCLGGGPSVDLSTLTGPLLVNLWYSACGPCREEMPELQAYYEKHGERVGVLGIDIENYPEAAISFAETVGATYPQLADPGSYLFDQAELRLSPAFPQTLLLDAEGAVVGRQAGDIGSLADIEEFVDAHLGAGDGR